VKPARPKFGVPPIAPMMPPMKSVANAFTTVPKAAPMTNATARSITLPRMMKSRNPLSMAGLSSRAADTLAARRP
jgi:hypothetical protein